LFNIENKTGEPLVTVVGSKYVLANIVKKIDTDRIILHFVNYSKPVENIKIKVNLEGFVNSINKENIRLISPDYVPEELKNLTVKGNKLELTIQKLDIYNVVVID